MRVVELRGFRRESRTRGLKRRGRGAYAMDKPPILGVVERDGLVRLTPMVDVAARTVLRRLFKAFNLEDVEVFYMDDYPAHNALRSLGRHETVDYSIGEYARRKIHINRRKPNFLSSGFGTLHSAATARKGSPLHSPLQLPPQRPPPRQDAEDANNAHPASAIILISPVIIFYGAYLYLSGLSLRRASAALEPL